MMLWMRGIIALLVALSLAFPTAAQNWRDPDLGIRIRTGMATRDHIWLLGETHKLVRFTRATGAREVVAEGVRDLLPDGDKLWALVESEPHLFFLHNARSPSAGGPMVRPEPPYRLYLHSSEDSEGEVLGLMAWPGDERPAVVTQRMVLEPTPGTWRRRPLAGSLMRRGLLATPDGRAAYVGYNRGEWGGGLRHIDLQSGRVSFVAETVDESCGERLNPACAPMVGLFPDRETPGCVIAGSGIAHLSSSRGNVFRVCGETITPVFSTPVPETPDRWMAGPQPWPLHGLFETADGWIGVSRDRYFRSRGGRIEEHPMPAFRDWSGLRLSEEQEGVLLLVSACCWGTVDSPSLYSVLALPVAP